MFLTEANYDYSGNVKKCLYFPNIVIQFKSKTNIVEVLQCFSCDEFEFYYNTKKVYMGNSDNLRNELLSISKILFPDEFKNIK